MSGWIKLHRSIVRWEWYDDIPCRLLFFHLLINANYKDVYFKGTLISRGQIVTGLPSLSEKLATSIQQTRTAISKLKSTGDITVKTTNKHSIITVVNYEAYQGATDESTDNQQSINSLANTESTTRERSKEKKNERKKEKNIYTLEFLNFWEKTNYPKRVQDSKGEMFKKYNALVKAKITPEDILFSSNLYAEQNLGNEYTIGLRKFLVKETVESYLDGTAVVKKTAMQKSLDDLDIALGKRK